MENVLAETIPLLNHGHVRLVSYTQPATLINAWTGDFEVVRNARTSYAGESKTGKSVNADARLLHRLVEDMHTSPLESMSFTFEAKAPIFVFRQWHRHRTWCVTGDTKLEFIRPVDGKPYKMTIKDIVDSWNPQGAKRRRADQSPLSLEEHNRKRIMGMRIRAMDSDGEVSDTNITNAFYSGQKEVFEIVAGGKTITASADHLFYSEGKYLPLKDLLGRKVTLLGRAGGTKYHKQPVFTLDELDNEVWHEFADGHRVSSLGRVQTAWGQGFRKKGEWKPRSITISNRGRATVSVNDKPLQVSRLVASAFLEQTGPQALHKNDNPLDNRSSNLYWGSAKDNSDDQYKNGGRVKRTWVEAKVDSVTSKGVQDVYDITVADSEHNFVANNFLVHNCFSELSGRYQELPEEFYVPELCQITCQSTANKQQRTDELHPEADRIQDMIMNSCMESFRVYHQLLALSPPCPRELARTVLPLATYSHMFGTVNLLNLLKFCKLRIHGHAQYEIRVYAEAMLRAVATVCPEVVAAAKRYWLIAYQ